MCQFCDQLEPSQQNFSYLDDLPRLNDLLPLNSSNSSPGLSPRLRAGLRQVKGNSQSNILQGTDSADRLLGLNGDDKIQGRGGQDILSGGGGNDSLVGGAGNDRLNGGSGQDSLWGGQGNDTFILKRLDGRLAKIQDFESKRDRLLIDRGGFELSLSSGSLAANRLVAGNRATKATQRFVYHRNSGRLYFDADGSGRKEQRKIAVLSPNTKLVASDIVISGNVPQPSQPPSVDQSFDIKFNFLDDGLSQSQRAVFKSVARRWGKIITGDVPDVRLSNGRVIDDIEINVRAPVIDGIGRTLGQAGPAQVRFGSLLPFLGVIEFDRADLDSMESRGTLDELINHEVGHVLGFGTIWQGKGLVSGAGGNDPRFTGARAVQVFNQISNGPTVSSIPLENRGGSGSRDSHWRESVFGNELMSSLLADGDSPLSRLTIASMADIGYQVNLNAADSFVLG